MLRKIVFAAACFALCVASPAQASKLYISEYATAGNAPGQGALQLAHEPVITDQTPVDFSGGAAQSAALNSKTNFVRVWCDVQCSILFGTNPTATNANKPLGAAAPEYFFVPVGQSLKISVIANP